MKKEGKSAPCTEGTAYAKACGERAWQGQGTESRAGWGEGECLAWAAAAQARGGKAAGKAGLEHSMSWAATEHFPCGDMLIWTLAGLTLGSRRCLQEPSGSLLQYMMGVYGNRAGCGICKSWRHVAKGKMISGSRVTLSFWLVHHTDSWMDKLTPGSRGWNYSVGCWTGWVCDSSKRQVGRVQRRELSWR